MELSQRKLAILKAVVEQYIQKAEPIGSKTLANFETLNNVSAATIRNEMAELEELGYLEQPHVSAGRIPTHKGYRLFVNQLMVGHTLSVTERTAIDKALNIRIAELDRLIFEVSRMVAAITQYTAYAITPQLKSIAIKRFEIIPVDKKSMVVVAVTDTGAVKNRILRVKGFAEAEEISLLARALNAGFANIEIDKISIKHIKTVEYACPGLAFLVPEILSFVSEIYDEMVDSSVYIGGSASLLAHPEYKDADKAKKVLDFLADSKQLAKIDYPHDKDIFISIGNENQADELSEATTLMTRYNFGGMAEGVIGLVGPTRMDYAKMIARLSYFAKGFNKLLNQAFYDDANEENE